MTYDVRITPHPDRRYTLVLHLTRGSLAISGGKFVKFDAPLRPGGNVDRITDEPTLDFLLAIMRVKTVEWVSLSSTGALVQYSSEIGYLQCAWMLHYTLRPPPDDPHPFLAEKVDILVESLPEGDEDRLPGVPRDTEWFAVPGPDDGTPPRLMFMVRRFDPMDKPVPEYLRRLQKDPGFQARVQELYEYLNAFVPPGVTEQTSPQFLISGREIYPPDDK